MIQRFGSIGKAEAPAPRPLAEPPPPLLRPASPPSPLSRWQRFRAWLRFLWGIEAHVRQTQKEHRVLLSHVVRRLNQLEDALQKTLGEIYTEQKEGRGAVESLAAANSESFQALEEKIPTAACRLDINRVPLNFAAAPESVQVELVSHDGKHRFLRPLSHPDVAACLQRGDFIARKVE